MKPSSGTPHSLSGRPVGARRRWLFRLVAVGAALLAAELALQVAALLSPALRRAIFVKDVPWYWTDPRLGALPNPEHPDHDAWGYRNPSVPDRADVVTFGDSQTYGYGVGARDTWPRCLARLGGVSVYSIAFGGWGPIQHLLLWDRAEQLKPHLIVQALYAGNDLWDCYHLVYDLGRLPDLRPPDPDTARAIQEAEEKAPLLNAIRRQTEPVADDGQARPIHQGALGRFARRCAGRIGLCGIALKAYRFANAALLPGDLDEWQRARAATQTEEANRWAIDLGGVRTILTPGYRLVALDMDDPRIREGHRLMLSALSRMQANVRRINATFVVLLIPTKELVFKDFVERAGVDIPPAYSRLIAMEEQVWRRMTDHLDQEGIPWMDALPALRACLSRGESPYPISADGHPNAVGHRAIAEELARELRRRGDIPSGRSQNAGGVR